MRTPSPSASNRQATPSTSAVPTLQELAKLPESQIDVALGSALIAKDVYPNLDVGALLAQLDQMAAPLFSLRLEEKDAVEQSEVLGAHIYGTLGFRGNESDYYDPKNSLLSDVLARKLGIPITLAVVYCEIARRVGVPARGVGFPGHFLVRIDRSTHPGEPSVTIDPFYSGRVLDDEAIERLLRRAIGPDETKTPADFLSPASAKAVLVRILTNLKAIYMTRGDHARALLATDRILLFSPNAPAVLREHGALAARLGAHESAKADLQRALELEPHATDARAVRAQIAELERKNRKLN